MDLWCTAVRSSLSLKDRYQKRVILVLFENLVQSPRETMKSVCETVDLTWSEALTTPTFNSMPIMANSSFGVRERGVIKDSIDRFTGRLTDDELRTIGRIAMPLYEEATEVCTN